MLKGKVGYMAPEYCELGIATTKSDVFSLGIVGREELANRKPFDVGNEVEMLRRIVHGPLPLVSSVAPWLGSSLDAVVTRALERAPEARYASVRDFAEALESAAHASDLL